MEKLTEEQLEHEQNLAVKRAIFLWIEYLIDKEISKTDIPKDEWINENGQKMRLDLD